MTVYGKEIFLKVCEILDQNVPRTLIIYEREKVTKVLLENLNGIDGDIGRSIINKLPDFFTFVIESRMKNSNNINK